LQEDSIRVSYYQKTPSTCPVCNTIFKKEEMLTGRGRLIAKAITDELRRIYEPSKKAGEINPLIYAVTVCPECYYSAFAEDFNLINPDYLSIAKAQSVKRKSDVKLIFPVVDFKKPRNMFTGTAGYILAISCYSFHKKGVAPTFKKALSSLRAAWLFGDLDKKYPGQNYGRIKMMMYKKAMYYYELTIDYAQIGKEVIDHVKSFGPDLDKNYGFQGLLFISSLLLLKYGDRNDIEKRIQKLTDAKRIISKIFGLGNKSKEKPTHILELSKDVYKKINKEIEDLGGK